MHSARWGAVAALAVAILISGCSSSSKAASTSSSSSTKATAASGSDGASDAGGGGSGSSASLSSPASGEGSGACFDGSWTRDWTVGPTAKLADAYSGHQTYTFKTDGTLLVDEDWTVTSETATTNTKGTTTGTYTVSGDQVDVDVSGSEHQTMVDKDIGTSEQDIPFVGGSFTYTCDANTLTLTAYNTTLSYKNS